MCREAVKYIQDHLTIPVDALGRETIMNVARTSMSSKIIGPYPCFFAIMCLTLVNITSGLKN